MSEMWAGPRPTVPCPLEVDGMSRGPHDEQALPRRPRRRRRPHGRARHAPRSAPLDDRYERASELDGIDPALLNDDERAYLDARRRAEDKVDLYRELFRVGPIALVLLIFLFPVGVVFTAYQAWRLGRRVYQTLIEPRVRERVVSEEVGEGHVHIGVDGAVIGYARGEARQSTGRGSLR